MNDDDDDDDCREAESRLISAALFVYIFNDSYLTNCLKICRTDLRAKICRVGRTMAVDDRSENSFSVSQGTLPLQQFCWRATLLAAWRGG